MASTNAPTSPNETHITPNFVAVPKKFGAAGDYWNRFNDVARTDVREMIEALTEDAQTSLLFAGLFAGVDIGFLALCVPLLNPDQTSETERLLRLMIQQNSGLSISPSDLDTPDFSPSAAVVRINSLASVSLNCSVIAGFFGMLALQWLFSYGRNCRGGSSEEEVHTLQLRMSNINLLGLSRLVSVVLPTLLQVGLILFCIAFVEFLQELSPIAANLNIGLFSGAALVFLASVAHGIWDPNSSYQTPLSKFIVQLFLFPFDTIPSFTLMATRHLPTKLIRKALRALGSIMKTFFRHPLRSSGDQLSYLSNSFDRSFWRTVGHRLDFKPVSRIVKTLRRKDDSAAVLNAKSTCWMLERSENKRDIQSVALNVTAISDEMALRVMLRSNVPRQFHLLFRSTVDQALSGERLSLDDKEDDIPLLAEEAMIYGRAVIHLYVSLRAHDDWFWDTWKTKDDTWFSDWRSGDLDPSVRSEISCQRMVVQAGLNIHIADKPVGSGMNPDALPIYLAGGIKTLLHRYIYHTLSHYPSRPYRGSWRDTAVVEEFVYLSFGDNPSPIAANLTAWALATLPERSLTVPVTRPDTEVEPVETYKTFHQDYDGIWDAYFGDASLLKNLSSALDVYSNILYNTSPTRTAPPPPRAAYVNLLTYLKEYSATQEQLRNDAAGFTLSAGKLLSTIKQVHGSDPLEDLATTLIEAARSILKQISPTEEVNERWFDEAGYVLAALDAVMADGTRTPFMKKLRAGPEATIGPTQTLPMAAQYTAPEDTPLDEKSAS